MNSDPTKRLSKKLMAGLVYVVLAILVVSTSAAMSYSNTQWFSTSTQLSVNINQAIFMLNSTLPSVLIKASVENPTGFGGIQLLDVNYAIFVNSTTEPFLYLGSTSAGMGNAVYNQYIPEKGSLNITFNLYVYSAVASQLRDFVNRHPTDLQTIAGATLDLRSSFGPLHIEYCYELPGQTPTICPPSPQSRGRRPGGG